MAHFAQLDENNIVIQVTVVSNDDAPDEATGIAFCKAIYGSDTNWKQTSYNSRGNRHLLSGTPFHLSLIHPSFSMKVKRDMFPLHHHHKKEWCGI